jgi:hypothetical protein
MLWIFLVPIWRKIIYEHVHDGLAATAVFSNKKNSAFTNEFEIFRSHMCNPQPRGLNARKKIRVPKNGNKKLGHISAFCLIPSTCSSTAEGGRPALPRSYVAETVKSGNRWPSESPTSFSSFQKDITIKIVSVMLRFQFI